MDLGGSEPDAAKLTAKLATTLAESMRIITMFPQMPDPMPVPSTSAEELREEIESRDSRMAASGRDPHKDAHGRKYTHKSTSNVRFVFVFVVGEWWGVTRLHARRALTRCSRRLYLLYDPCRLFTRIWTLQLNKKKY